MDTKRAEFAVVSGVAATYDECIKRPGMTEPIDVELARRQHGRYCQTLESLGLELIRIEPDDRYPDCCYVEDPVVVVDSAVMILNVGAPSRVGEAEAIRGVMGTRKKVYEMKAPATLDGGDVMFAGGRFYVGLTDRSNREGFESFERVANELGFEAIPVPLRNVLHLKSACTHIGEDHLLVAPDCFDRTIFHNFQQVLVSKEEEYSANCLGVNGKVLVSHGYPHAKSAVEAAGFDTIEMQMSEFYKGGGSLTCLSIIF